MRANLAMLIAPVCLGILCSAAPARADQGYRIHDLGALTYGGGQPEVVAGHYIAPVYNGEEEPSLGFPPDRYVILGIDADRIAALGTLGGYRTTVYAMNDLGVLAGSSDVPLVYTPDGVAAPHHAFKAFPSGGGGLIDLGTFTQDPRFSSTAFGLNASGWVVGRAGVGLVVTPEYSTYPQHAFLDRGQGLIDLGTLATSPLFGSVANAVNTAGQVVGAATLDPVYTDIGVAVPAHAFLWEGGVMHDLGTLGTDTILSSYAYGLNDSGQIVGTSATQIVYGDGWEMVEQHAFVTGPGGGLIDLGTLGGYNSSGSAIDASGRVAGWSTLAAESGLPWDEEQHAIVWEHGHLIDLGSLAPGRPGGAYAFSNDGRIYGLAYDADWNFHLVYWERGESSVHRHQR